MTQQKEKINKLCERCGFGRRKDDHYCYHCKRKIEASKLAPDPNQIMFQYQGLWDGLQITPGVPQRIDAVIVQPEQLPNQEGDSARTAGDRSK